MLENATQIQALAESVRQALAAKLKALPAMASAYAGDFLQHATSFAQAPVVLIALHKRPVSLSAALLDSVASPALVSGEPLSVAMAVQNLMLAAQALGLGSCVLTAPLIVPGAVASTLTLPDGFELTCLVAVGYPDEAPEMTRRKELEHIVEFGNNPRQTG